jgi:putative DNA primase/helicase
MIRQNGKIGGGESGDLPPYTDQVLAEAFIDEHEPKLRFVPQWGKWMVFDGRRWCRDETYQALDLVRAFLRTAAKQAIDIDLKTVRKLLSKEKLHTVEGVARLDRRIIATPDQWDSDPLLLNTPDGDASRREPGHMMSGPNFSWPAI